MIDIGSVVRYISDKHKHRFKVMSVDYDTVRAFDRMWLKWDYNEDCPDNTGIVLYDCVFRKELEEV